MTRFGSSTAIAAILSCSALTASAGGMHSGGGDLFVCGKKKNRVYLADTYALKDSDSFKLFAKLSKKATHPELLNAATAAAKALDPESAVFLTTVLDPESPTRITFRTTSENLPELEDDDLVVPSGCEKRQLAIQTLHMNSNGQPTSEVLVREDYLENLTPAERIFFLIHEGYIRKRLESENGVELPNTAHIRNKVAALSKENAFLYLAEAITRFSGPMGGALRDVYHSLLSGNVAELNFRVRARRTFSLEDPEWERNIARRAQIYSNGFLFREGQFSEEEASQLRSVLQGRIIGAEIPSFFERTAISISALPSAFDRVQESFGIGLTSKSGTFEAYLIDVRTGEKLLKVIMEVDKQGGIEILKIEDSSQALIHPQNGRVKCHRPKHRLPALRFTSQYSLRESLEEYTTLIPTDGAATPYPKDASGTLLYECRSQKTHFRGGEVIFAVSGEEFTFLDEPEFRPLPQPVYYFTADGGTVPLPRYSDMSEATPTEDLDAVCVSDTRPALDAEWKAKGGAKLKLPTKLRQYYESQFTIPLIVEFKNRLPVYNTAESGWPIRHIEDSEANYRLELELKCKATLLPFPREVVAGGFPR